MMDKILDFHLTYDKNHFYWNESSLYYFLSEYYGLCDVLIETSYGMVLVKKYNVVGYIDGDEYITVYESIGELENIVSRVFLDTIYSVEVLL
jgi:hypothetical protein